MTHALATQVPQTQAYDAAAWFYDWVVGSDLYHRFMWDMPATEHARFAELALSRAKPGEVLDAGCGSLLFTSGTYRSTPRGLTLYDGSVGMLARARRRLGPAAAKHRLERGDLYDLPFADAVFAAALHFGVLHCLAKPEVALRELWRVTQPGGALSLSCLVLSGRSRGNAWLRRLNAAGHVAAPRHASEVLALVSDAGFELESQQAKGSFLFVHARKPEPFARLGR
jgi:ubiquinone/menaquinone biosynthesis C-methylase UbiE